MKKQKDQKVKSEEKKVKRPSKTLEDFKYDMAERVKTRLNIISGKYECRWLERMDGDMPEGFGEHGEFGKEWHELTDREENALWRLVCPKREARLQDVMNILRSDFTPLYNPILEYLAYAFSTYNLEDDAIGELTRHVHVITTDADPDTDKDRYERLCREEQRRFNEYFKKWFVGMIAGATSQHVVNNVVLVLIGEQGTYKSTFFAQLLPPKLRQYFHVKTDNTVLNKDDRLQLARNHLICLEEIDVLSKKELNQLKAMVTLPSINDRPAYARNFVNLPHIASLCGTGNNETFLSDPTGSRRWLPFLVESIDDPRSYEINYESLYGQGMYLLADKFRYWFTQEEIKRQNSRNKAFEADCLEEQLIMKYYRIPTLAETGVLVTAGDILEKINKGIKKPLSSTAVGTIMRKIGFSWKIVHGYRKYRVIDLKDSDIQELMKNEAIETDDRAF